MKSRKHPFPSTEGRNCRIPSLPELRKGMVWAGGAVLLFYLGSRLLANITVTAAGLFYVGAHGNSGLNQWLNRNFSTVSVGGMLVNIAASLTGLACAWLVLRKGKAAPPVRELFLFQKKDAGLFLRLLPVGIGVQMAGSYLASGITGLADRAGWSFSTPPLVPSGGMAANILLLVFTCAVAPVCEEIIFRGLTQRGLSQGSAWFGIIASSLLFGLYHMNLPQAVAAAGMGLVLGYAAARSGHIAVGILLHVSMNVYANLANWLALSRSWGNAAVFFVSIGLIAAGAGILVWHFLCVKRRGAASLPFASRGMGKLSWKAFFTSWTILAALILCVASTLPSISRSAAS